MLRRIESGIAFRFIALAAFRGEIGGERVVGVALEHGAQEGPGAGNLAEAEPGLRLEEQGGGFLPKLQIIIEQQHRRQRRGEIVDPGFARLELPRVGQQVPEQLLGFGLPAQFSPRQGRVIGHFAEGAHAHFLEVAPERGRGAPVFARSFGIAEGGEGATEPVMEIALIGEQVSGFAQVGGGRQSRLKVRSCSSRVIPGERRSSQQQMRTGPLTQRTAFAAFPRLEMAAAHQRERLGGLAGLVVERAEFDAEIIALADQVEVLLEFAQTSARDSRRGVSRVGRVRTGVAHRPDSRGRPGRRRRGPGRVGGGC